MPMKKYSTVVVGTDGSTLAGPTVARAAALAKADDADLVIVCAFTPVPRRADAKNVATLGGDAKFDQVPGEASAGLALEEAMAVAKEVGARVSAAQLVDGDAAAALLHVADERGADVIVIGAIRDRSMAERLLGTVAEEVLHKATCDVLVVRPLAGDPEPNRPEDAPAGS